MRAKEFVHLCKMSQKSLKAYCASELRLFGYDDVVNKDGFLYARGNLPCLLTAHLDTVHKKKVNTVIRKDGVISAPNGIGGDDRCGVYIILSIIRETALRPSILFCEDEESGGVGSEKFCKTKYINELKKMKYLIEIDRHGKDDAVFYNCANFDFIKWIEKETGFKEKFGSFSDISNLSPWCDVASVNLSCGYYQEHHTDEYVVWNHVVNSRNVVRHLVEISVTAQAFDYQEEKWSWYPPVSKKRHSLYILYKDTDGLEYDCEYYGESDMDSLGEFFWEHPDICFNDIIDYYYQ